jgi:hypothetical protein
VDVCGLVRGGGLLVLQAWWRKRRGSRKAPGAAPRPYANGTLAVPAPSTVTTSHSRPWPGPGGATHDREVRPEGSSTTTDVQLAFPMVTVMGAVDPGGAKFWGHRSDTAHIQSPPGWGGIKARVKGSGAPWPRIRWDGVVVKIGHGQPDTKKNARHAAVWGGVQGRGGPSTQSGHRLDTE